MSVEVALKPEAAQDINAAYVWYEKRQAGLGEDFIGCIEACFEEISEYPESYPLVHDDFRRAMTQRFP